jgi:hypothetical protein
MNLARLDFSIHSRGEALSVLEHDGPRALATGVVFVSHFEMEAIPKEECLPHPNPRLMQILSGPSNGQALPALFACKQLRKGTLSDGLLQRPTAVDFEGFAFWGEGNRG